MYENIKRDVKTRRLLMNICWVIIILQFLADIIGILPVQVLLLGIVVFSLIGISVYYNQKIRTDINKYAYDHGYAIASHIKRNKIIMKIRKTENESELLELVKLYADKINKEDA